MLLSSGTMDKNVVSNVPRIMASFEDLSNYMLAYFGAFWRRGGLMVSMLYSGSSGPGSGPGRGHCVVFVGKTLYSHGASLHPLVLMGTGESNAGGSPAMD